jgi:urease accessory protein
VLADLANDCIAPDDARWRARLALAFAHDAGRTTLARRTHSGPLVVQKAFHPEGDAVCQVVVVHPPGGIAGGDALSLTLDVAADAHAQVTMPGASKWYRSAGAHASQDVVAHLAPDATLEWMPPGAIVFDGARARSTLRVELSRSAHLVAWDLVCLGRSARGERFTDGEWRQRIEIVRDGALLWSERVNLAGGSRMLEAAAGLNGAPVFGTFLAVSPRLDDSAVPLARAVVPTAGEGAVTLLPDVLVARWRGPASDAGHRYCAALWSALRPSLIGRPAVPPRIWTT